jgi:hypothetical protein
MESVKMRSKLTAARIKQKCKIYWLLNYSAGRTATRLGRPQNEIKKFYSQFDKEDMEFCKMLDSLKSETIDIPDCDDLTLPDTDIELPDVDIELPDVDFEI